MLIRCDYCGKEFERTHVHKEHKHHFCTKRCEWLWKSENFSGDKSPFWKGGKVECKCNVCGRTIFVKADQRKERNYCSPQCYGKWQSKNQRGEHNPHWQGGNTHLICETCGRSYTCVPATAKLSKHHFCSAECRVEWQKTPRNHPSWKGGKIKTLCETCGKEFELWPCEFKHNKGRFCSKTCARRCNKIRGKTDIEQVFEEICRKNNLPFRYTGDGTFWIGGHPPINPDFVEVNDKKIAIEIFGDYWHSPFLRPDINYAQTYEGKRRLLKERGWNLVVFLGSDLVRKDAERFVLRELFKQKIKVAKGGRPV